MDYCTKYSDPQDLFFFFILIVIELISLELTQQVPVLH